MKLLSILIVLFLNSNFLVSNENWIEIVPNQTGTFRYMHILNDNIYQLDIDGNYNIYNFKSKELVKEGYITSSAISTINYYNNHFYIPTINLNATDSKILVLDNDFNLVAEKPYFMENLVVNSLLFLEDKIIYGSNVLQNQNAVIAKSDTNFENFEYETVNYNGFSELYINNIEKNDEVMYFLTFSGKLYSSALDEFNWVNIETMNSFNIESTRGLIVENDLIVIVGGYGRVLISQDNTESFKEVSNLGVDLRPSSYKYINGNIYIAGYDHTTEVGYVFYSNDLGKNWIKILENSIKVYSLEYYEDKLFCQLEDGSIFSVDESVYSSVDSKENITCQNIQAQKYYDILGNELRQSNIFDKQIIVRYKCLETGEFIHKLEIRTK